MNSAATATSLCLVIEASNGEESAIRLAAALDAAAVACVIVAPPTGGGLSARSAQPLVAMAQARDIAAVLWHNAELARTLKADGVHVPWSSSVLADYKEAREILDARAIVGVDAGRSRHEAMALGEAGASYVGFGVPSEVREQDKARERRLELIAWWSEIIEIPCVAFDVERPEEAAALAGVGADFVGIDIRGGLALPEIAEQMAAIGAAIKGGKGR